MLPFVAFSAKPNPVLPAAEKRDTLRESPPSIQFQFTFQFQGALLARVCLSDAKVINKKVCVQSKKKEQKRGKNCCGIIICQTLQSEQ